MPNERKITHGGITDTLTGWAARTGIPATTIKARLDGLGWDAARALTAPPDRRFRRGGRRPKDAPRPCPPMKRHPAKGLAYARWSVAGKDVWRYFGAWGSDDAREAYRRFQLEWAAGCADPKPEPGAAVLVGDVILRWLGHCQRTYRKRDRATSEYHCNRAAMKHVAKLFGTGPAAEFDGKRLRTAREAMVGEGWTRKTINDHVARVVRAWAWAATEGLVPVGVAEVLAKVEPIAPGRRADVREGAARKPVPVEHVEAACPHLHPKPKRRAVYEAMVRLQLASGIRPGELCSLTPEQIDRRREPWRVEFTDYNKMLHREVRRVVFFGPVARQLLAPFLAVAEPGQPVFRLPPWRKKADWSPVSVVRYRNRVRLACRAAGVPTWVPHQLRHNKATDVMERYEDDRAAGAAIGDSPEVARQVYAHAPGEAVARRIAEETG